MTSHPHTWQTPELGVQGTFLFCSLPGASGSTALRERQLDDLPLGEPSPEATQIRPKRGGFCSEISSSIPQTQTVRPESLGHRTIYYDFENS